MKITILSCVFPPEPIVAGRAAHDVARELIARGHQVTAVTPFPNRPSGRLYAGFRRAPFRTEADSGLRIVRCFSILSQSSSMLSRMAENVSFGVTSSLALLFGRKPAVMYMNSWPIFASAMAAAVARLRGIPTVVSLQDIYPESLLSQRRRGGKLIAGVLLALDRFVVRGAAAVVAISDSFAEHYLRTRGVEPARMHMVPNWLPAEGTEERAGAAEACRERNGIPRDAFLLAYGGNVGVSATVETVIEAFRLLQDLPDVHLLIAGEGASLDNCIRLAAEIAPDRIHFEHPWKDTMGVLHAADVVVLSTKAAQTIASVPSKLISYLLSARPVIAMALPGSDTLATVERSGAGRIVQPDDPPAVAGAIREMRRLSAAERQQMGRAGRAWAMANVTREVLLPRLAGIVESAAR